MGVVAAAAAVTRGGGGGMPRGGGGGMPRGGGGGGGGGFGRSPCLRAPRPMTRPSVAAVDPGAVVPRGPIPARGRRGGAAHRRTDAPARSGSGLGNRPGGRNRPGGASGIGNRPGVGGAAASATDLASTTGPGWSAGSAPAGIDNRARGDRRGRQPPPGIDTRRDRQSRQPPRHRQGGIGGVGNRPESTTGRGGIGGVESEINRESIIGRENRRNQPGSDRPGFDNRPGGGTNINRQHDQSGRRQHRVFQGNLTGNLRRPGLRGSPTGLQRLAGAYWGYHQGWANGYWHGYHNNNNWGWGSSPWGPRPGCRPGLSARRSTTGATPATRIPTTPKRRGPADRDRADGRRRRAADGERPRPGL